MLRADEKLWIILSTQDFAVFILFVNDGNIYMLISRNSQFTFIFQFHNHFWKDMSFVCIIFNFKSKQIRSVKCNIFQAFLSGLWYWRSSFQTNINYSPWMYVSWLKIILEYVSDWIVDVFGLWSKPYYIVSANFVSAFQYFESLAWL